MGRPPASDMAFEQQLEELLGQVRALALGEISRARRAAEAPEADGHGVEDFDWALARDVTVPPASPKAIPHPLNLHDLQAMQLSGPFTLKFSGSSAALADDAPRPKLKTLGSMQSLCNGEWARATFRSGASASKSSSALSRSSTWRTSQQSQSSTTKSQREKQLVMDVIHSERHTSGPRVRCSWGGLVECAMTVVILLNCLAIGVSSDWQPESVAWDVFYGVCAGLFVAEQLGRAYQQRWEYLLGPARYWNLFELVQAVVSLVDFGLGFLGESESYPGILRLVRISRLLRLGLLLRTGIVKEITTIVHGTVAGLRCLFWATLLMLLPLYAAAIFFREYLGPYASAGHGAEMFATTSSSFLMTIRCVIIGECTDASGRPVLALMADEHGWGFVALFCSLYLFMVFGLFNVVVAVFIEQVLRQSALHAKQEERRKLGDQAFFVHSARALVTAINSHWCGRDFGSMAVANASASLDDPTWIMEMQNHKFPVHVVREALELPEVQLILMDLAIAVEDTRNLAELMDADGNGTVDLGELLDALYSLRGAVCRYDMVALRFQVEQLRTALLRPQGQVAVPVTPGRSKSEAAPPYGINT